MRQSAIGIGPFQTTPPHPIADQIDPQQMIFRGPQFKLRKIKSVSQ